MGPSSTNPHLTKNLRLNLRAAALHVVRRWRRKRRRFSGLYDDRSVLRARSIRPNKKKQTAPNAARCPFAYKSPICIREPRQAHWLWPLTYPPPQGYTYPGCHPKPADTYRGRGRKGKPLRHGQWHGGFPGPGDPGNPGVARPQSGAGRRCGRKGFWPGFALGQGWRLKADDQLEPHSRGLIWAKRG